MRFSQRKIKDFVAQLHRDLGPRVWEILSPRLRDALIAERVLDIIRQQDGPSVTVASVDLLLTAMRVEAGLAVEDEPPECRECGSTVPMRLTSVSAGSRESPTGREEVQVYVCSECGHEHPAT